MALWLSLLLKNNKNVFMKKSALRLAFITCYMFGLTTLSIAQELKTIQLLPPDMKGGKTVMEALNNRKSARDFAVKVLPLQQLSDLLWAANGLNRPALGKHTAPSAVNWQDVDIYVLNEEGIFLYDAKLSQLKPVNAGDYRGLAGTQAFVAKAPLNLVFVSDYARMKDAKEDVKAVYAAADAAFIAENVYLYCASADLAVVVRASIDKEKLAPMLKLSSSQHIVLAQTVGYPK